MSRENNERNVKSIILTGIIVIAILFFPVRGIVKRLIDHRKASQYEREERYEDAIEIYERLYKNNAEKRNEIIDELYEKILSRDYRKSLEVYCQMLESALNHEYEKALEIYDGIDFDLDGKIDDKAYRLYETCLNQAYGDD